MELSVLGFVDDAHAPATELFEDAVVRDGLANHGEGTASWRDMLGRAPRQVNERNSGG